MYSDTLDMDFSLDVPVRTGMSSGRERVIVICHYVNPFNTELLFGRKKKFFFFIRKFYSYCASVFMLEKNFKFFFFLLSFFAN